MKTKTLFLTLATLLIFTGSCNLQTNNNGETQTSLKTKVAILSTTSKWKGKGHVYERIFGEFKNNTGKELRAIKLQGTFYDNANNVLSTGIAIEKNIAVNELRSFEIVMDYSEKNANYKVNVTEVYQ